MADGYMTRDEVLEILEKHSLQTVQRARTALLVLRSSQNLEESDDAMPSQDTMTHSVQGSDAESHAISSSSSPNVACRSPQHVDSAPQYVDSLPMLSHSNIDNNDIRPTLYLQTHHNDQNNSPDIHLPVTHETVHVFPHDNIPLD